MAQHFCGSCGAPVKPGAHFCAKCGAPIDKAAPADAVPEPAAPMEAPANAGTPAAAEAGETRVMPQAVPAPGDQETVALPRTAPESPAAVPSAGFAAPGATAQMPPVAPSAPGAQQRVYAPDARPAAPMDAQKKGLIAGIVAAVVVIVVLVAVFVVPALANRGQATGTAATSSVTSSQDASSSSSPSSATGSSSSSDAASSSSSSAAATSSSSSSANLADEAAYEALVSLYGEMGSADQAISTCATDFNNTYLSSDVNKRHDAAANAYSVQQSVAALLDDLQSLNISSGSPYYSDYQTMLQLQSDLQYRIDVICEAWSIDLQYTSDPKPYEAQITEPLGRDKVNGSNKYKQDFDKVYPSAKPQKK